ncbi:MAG: polyprenyl synthetase family protein [Clostridia bacterium]|nr:polyprenyl synthetase family protein [Clostridia bacterium]
MYNMKEAMKQKVMLTEEFLSRELKNCSPQKNLREIMEYAVMNGGKRLRPVFLLAVYELFDQDVTKAVPYAAAMEMIHSYSLVHDDLPCMDNDDLRRGKPTCHKQFSEFGAVLAGDALLNLSMETMLKYADGFPVERALSAMKYITTASGAKGMCAGQMSDMEQSVNDFDSLSMMYSRKTGALLKASVAVGAILGGAKKETVSLLEQYADTIGLMFQIQDDVLDVTSDAQTLGKPILSDEKNQKITFVSEYGLERCRVLLQEYETKAISLLDMVAQSTCNQDAISFLKDLTLFLANRNH